MSGCLARPHETLGCRERGHQVTVHDCVSRGYELRAGLDPAELAKQGTLFRACSKKDRANGEYHNKDYDPNELTGREEASSRRHSLPARGLVED